MAGIGFELRKLYQEEGIVGNLKAYAYSSMTTIGPMILCIFLVIVQQQLMSANAGSFFDRQLFISTMTYSFIFSIMFTGGINMVLTRHVADMLYQKNYDQIISSFYGALIVVLPVAGITTAVFLYGVDESLGYKSTAYIFFIELIIIWIQNVYMSALKDYKRIVRAFTIGVFISLIVSFLVFRLALVSPVISAIIGMDVGFLVIVAMGMYHFEQVFPRDKKKNYFAFFSTFRKYPIILFSGFFLYSSVYVHNFMYWLFSGQSMLVAERYLLAPFYDLPVFYAYLSVVPSLVLFVIVVETDFYESFVNYYKNVLNGGTYKSMNNAKTKMQSVLLHRVGFLVEAQLLFTALAIAFGIIYLPKIGFSMNQLDLYILLCLGYFFFIIAFVMIHALMYFDDRKGVLAISALYFVLNGFLTIATIQMGIDGLGMFVSSFLMLVCTIARLLYVLSRIDYYTFLSQPVSMKTMKKKKVLSLFGIVLSSFLFLVGCSDKESGSSLQTQEIAEEQIEIGGDDKLLDDKRLYERDEDGSIKTLYITILPKKSEKKQDVDWYALNRITDRYSEESLDIIMSEGLDDGKGSIEGMFGHGAVEANAKISIRGNTARYAAQKSYKLKLFDSAGLWRDQRTINLNKHISDLSRVRNKLSFDLMENIPNITSLRTQFIHLYVKDMTTNNNGTYEDYGLYTQIEQPNEMFLKNHWLDPNGYLYKVSFFEFYRYPEFIKSHTDPTYDKKQFETILEVKGREEHDKLIAMLDDVNNKAIPIEDVIEKHFDLDNLMTWAAINILMDNMDTDANNFYLYSPLNSEKWFILPWDYDGGWELQRKSESIRPYQAGISNLWGNELFNRYFRSEKNVHNLIDKVEELSEVINRETIDKQLASYEEVVKPFLFRQPDSNYLPGVNTNFENDLQLIRNTPDRAKQRFYEDLQKPKPFYMDDIVVNKEEIMLSWVISYDLQMDNLLYNVSVATDPLFTDIVVEKKGLKENYFTIGKLPPGKYFWKVTVTDSKGNEQSSFDIYMDEEGNNFYGIREFEVE
ncbi:exopolysaccharide Pel transporter PelG [Psychrobacillus sp. NPDC096623]|uniref:exopolysaccharide Pel transporter PelG n=1 Tax=Psychrobacillus sp. NPDC096623 TaxID=3364492 RepID=UPI0038286BDD